MVNAKEVCAKEWRIAPGHKLCAGCAASIIAKLVLSATDKPVIMSCATGCLEVATTIYPYSSWKIPWIHNAFENAAATISGAESAFKALKKKGKISKDIRFVAFGGDGGTYDIGLQSLSGTLERAHNIVYVCYDNEAYMNTGIQRSSATPLGASTTTDPVGKVRQGKQEYRKDLTSVIAGHKIPYVAQTSLANWADLFNKARKAFEVDGPAFINVLSPCMPGWGIPSNKTIELSKIAEKTCFWPSYEVENGKYAINFDPADNKLPITEWLKLQARYKHLFKPENKWLIDKIQDHVDYEWKKLKHMAKMG